VKPNGSNGQALTRCIGQPGLPAVDLKVIPLLPGDRYLFATDGITRMITDEELTQLLAADDEPVKILQTVIHLALERGGYDNVTGVIVMVDEV
jgi:protein phosphatase